MSGALRRTMVFLGLAEDYHADSSDLREERDHDDDDELHAVDVRDREVESAGAEVTHLPRHRPVAVVSSPGHELRRITTVHPRNYNDAKVIGESFRDGVPVILNLTELDDADAKRLVDFSAGLIFGLRGSIERVTSKVFLLSPETVEITADTPDSSRSDLAGAFFNQS